MESNHAGWIENNDFPVGAAAPCSMCHRQLSGWIFRILCGESPQSGRVALQKLLFVSFNFLDILPFVGFHDC
jgi:hypothetical protein